MIAVAPVVPSPARGLVSSRTRTRTTVPAPAPKGQGLGGLHGLVSYETTPRTGDGIKSVDLAHARLSRMANGVRTAARLHCEAFRNGGRRYKCWMVTLTYRPGVEWEPGHIAQYQKRFQRWCESQGASYRFAWVAEMQKRGVIHYHFLCWLPHNLAVPKPDKRGMWPHGMTQRKQVYAPVKYAIKYTSKGSSELEQFPKGARLFGVGGLHGRERDERRWWSMPQWVREQASIDDRPFRCKDGGIELRASARFLSSPWHVVGVSNGRLIIARKIPADTVH